MAAYPHAPTHTPTFDCDTVVPRRTDSSTRNCLFRVFVTLGLQTKVRTSYSKCCTEDTRVCAPMVMVKRAKPSAPSNSVRTFFFELFDRFVFYLRTSLIIIFITYHTFLRSNILVRQNLGQQPARSSTNGGKGDEIDNWRAMLPCPWHPPTERRGRR